MSQTGLEHLSQQIIGAAIEVHSILGPGLLESSYQACMCDELRHRSIPFDSQVTLPVVYKGRVLDDGYRIDLLIDRVIVCELKSVQALEAIHVAQLLTYLRLGSWRVGLLINFNVDRLTRGIKRVLNDPPLPSVPTPCPP